MTTTNWTIRHAEVHPNDLEVAWEFDDAGNTYTWTNVKHDTILDPAIIDGTNDSYGDALIRTINELKSLPMPLRHMVRVAQVNVTEDGGMSFIATAMTPVNETLDTMRVTLQR